MGVYIKGMEMPKDGYKTVYIHSNGCIYEPTSDNLIWNTVGKAIPVPPHGDLIERDAYAYPGDLVDEPVIIPADPAEEGE